MHVYMREYIVYSDFILLGMDILIDCYVVRVLFLRI